MKQKQNARADKLRGLARDVLVELLLGRAETDERFALWLDARLAARQPRKAGEPLDPEPFRLHAEGVLSMPASGHRRRYRCGWIADIDEAALEDLIGEAEPILAAGRGVDTLAIVMPVASALAEYWPECAEWDETLHEFFPRLSRLIAQAVLLDDVPRETRDDLAHDLGVWQAELAEHGADDAFSIAIAACMQGWDELGLEDVLAGRGQHWPLGASDPAESELTKARLAALDYMRRSEQFLRLSCAAGLHCDQAAMLSKMGRFEEAVALAHARLREGDDILRVAKAMAEAGNLAIALDLATWGLSVAPSEENRRGWYRETGKLWLARWLREMAHASGRRDTMLMAARMAFEESLARDEFRVAKTLADAPDWRDLRHSLLATLMAAPQAMERIEILLEEDLVDEAVSCVDPHNDDFISYPDSMLMRLAERAFADHPDWTIALAFRIADPIMSEGRSAQYAQAAEWLAIAARAYASRNRSGEWLTHLEGIIQAHRRKYALRRLLEALRSRMA